jgi:dolichol kinase
MTEFASVEQSYATELIRKSIHLISLAIPVVYYFISRNTALAILIPLALAFSLSDLARLVLPPVGALYTRFFGFLLRRHEARATKPRLNGATFVLMSAVICIWFFPKVIVITAFSILIISDTAAALIGRRYGRHPFREKSVEGTTAFFLTAMLVVAVAPKIEYLAAEYLIGAIAAIVGAFVEALSGDLIDDNLSIPISIGVVMWGLYMLLLPSLNVWGLDRIPT